MSCKTPILRAVFDSPTVQAVDADGIIQFPDVTTNQCCGSPVTGGVIALNQCGDYEVHFNASVVATAAGQIEVQMFKNGTPVPGAHAFGTAAAVGDNVSLSFTGLVSVDCCEKDITFRPTTATSIRVANVTLEEVN